MGLHRSRRNRAARAVADLIIIILLIVALGGLIALAQYAVHMRTS